MPHVLIVHESESERTELARELLAEGFTVAEADTSLAAVRMLWEGTFAAALLGSGLPRMNGASLEEHLRTLAPEILTLEIGREKPARLARKLAQMLDGAVAA